MVQLGEGRSVPGSGANPGTKEDLKALILAALEANYTSESPYGRHQTGNHYQSVRLGDTYTEGFRGDREEALDLVSFDGKKVLDLGSNLGEISRSARRRGAYLVDGYEVDPYFVQIANLINAYNHVTRVSFFTRDITKPGTYEERYQIVLAFSVFVYIKPVLEYVAGITDELLLLETHTLDDGIRSAYIDPVLPYFPHHRVLAETDSKAAAEDGGRRAVIAFAREEGLLPSVASTREAHPLTRAERDRDAPIVGVAAGGRPLFDVARTPWCDPFFRTWAFPTPEDLLAAVDGMQVDVDLLARGSDLRRALSGWGYWTLYIKGYLEHKRTGRLDPDNTYLRYLGDYFRAHLHDPRLLNYMSDPSRAAAMVERRYRDFDVFRSAGSDLQGLFEEVRAVEVVRVDPSTPGAHAVYLRGKHRPLFGTIDGYHRRFLARLFRVPVFPVVLRGE